MIFIDSYKFGNLLLDNYPATIAYSLRKLRADYAGSAIRVRRSSDNAETNIGFVGNELDTVSLLSFVGAGNAFVTTIYDQSTNGYNATQTTTTNQPIIVSAGALITDSGKPAIRFGDGNSEKSLNFAPFTFSDFSVFLVAKDTAFNALNYWLAGDNAGFATGGSGVYGYGAFAGTNILFSTIKNLGVRVLRTYLKTQLFRNGVQATVFTADSNGSIGTPTVSKLGGRGASLFFVGLLQEFIMLNTDQTANRTAIESNINSHYTIY